MAHRDDIGDLNETRKGFMDAGLGTATRQEWIERTGQDPLDPSTWNNTIVDVTGQRQRPEGTDR